jgi:hypothetical protein
MRTADESRAAGVLWSCAAASFLVICGIATWIFLDEVDAGWWEFVRSGLPVVGGLVVLLALQPRLGSQVAAVVGAVLVAGVTWTGIWTWSVGLMVGSFGLFVLTLSMAVLAFQDARGSR